MTHCPNCNQKLTDTSVWSVNKLLSESKSNTINEVAEIKKTGYCDKCGINLFKSSSYKVKEKIKELSRNYNELLKSIPLITSHNPFGWQYDTLGLVTAQSTTGTGVLTEIVSSFSDILGNQSLRHNSKIKSGEELCSNQLRQQVLEMGGNAVVALDIDYSELGGGKGMIMVCMSGTAIKIKNLEVLSEKTLYDLQQLPKISNEINRLLKLELYSE